MWDLRHHAALVNIPYPKCQGLGMRYAALMFLAWALIGNAYASNDCSATVKFESAMQRNDGVELAFTVTTQCASSVGRFEYTYESSTQPGAQLPRRSSQWRARDGRKFKWTETIPALEVAAIRNIKVIQATIESTKQ